MYVEEKQVLTRPHELRGVLLKKLWNPNLENVNYTSPLIQKIVTKQVQCARYVPNERDATTGTPDRAPPASRWRRHTGAGSHKGDECLEEVQRGWGPS